MDRRAFLQTAAAAAAPLIITRTAAARNPMDRIGMSTVTFRRRFVQTRPDDASPATPTLTLLDVPAFFRDRFGVRNIEFWSPHFESIEPAYLAELRRRIEAAGARLINVQMDEPYNLAQADETARAADLELVLRWVDAAAALGSEAIRVNPGQGDLETSIASLRAVDARAREHGLVFMTENHFGIEMDPAVHLQIVDAVGENCHTLPDFGNYDDEVRYEALRTIMPRAYQVSAKAAAFNAAGEHISYDYDRCMTIAAKSGFEGIYSVEQWSSEGNPEDDAAVADWLIERTAAHLAP